MQEMFTTKTMLWYLPLHTDDTNCAWVIPEGKTHFPSPMQETLAVTSKPGWQVGVTRWLVEKAMRAGLVVSGTDPWLTSNPGQIPGGKQKIQE